MLDGNEIKKSSFRLLIDRIGNPLEWSYVDRTLLLLSFELFFNLILVLIVYLLTRIPSLRREYFDLQTIPLGLGIHWKYILLLLLLISVAVAIRKHNPMNRAIVYGTAIAISAHSAWFTCTIGHSTNPAILLILFLHVFIGFLLFDYYFVSFALASWAIVIGYNIAGEQIGLFPYAVALTDPPFANGRIDPLWVVFSLGSGGIVVVWTLLLCGYVVHRWRKREAQVTELSEFLKKTFGRYISKEVMKTLIEKPDAVRLGGEKRRVTMMMTDLRGFTPLSERMDPQQVMALLNRYFNVMMEICKKYHGTINDIFGDALLVTFGAPQETEGHARAAVACAIEMQNAMESVNEENFRQDLPELEMGIGLNTAEVVVGNIGSEDRAKFGVVGSGVNMASRIESYTVGGQILISESVYKEAVDILRIDAQREVLPKGAETPLRIYQVGGIAGNYNLALEEKDHSVVSLLRRIPLQYKLLEGKDIGNQGLKGFVVRLSKKKAEIYLDSPVEVLTNLKMNLTEVEEDLISKDFYGKVIESPGEDRVGHIIRFTAISPEISTYFQAHRQYAAETAEDPAGHVQ